MDDLTLVTRWGTLVEPLAAWYGLDPRVVYAVMQLESAGYATALSEAGAVGLMQVMPREAGRWFTDRPPRQHLLDPAVNIVYGCKILKAGIDAFEGDLRRGLCSYYMGVVGVRQRGLESRDAQTYLAAFRRAWLKLYPDVVIPWNDKGEGDGTERVA